MFSKNAISVDKLIDTVLMFGSIRDGRGPSDTEIDRAESEFKLTHDKSSKFDIAQTLKYNNESIDLAIFGEVSTISKLDDVYLLESIGYTYEKAGKFIPELAILDWAKIKVLAYAFAVKKNVERLSIKINWYNRESLIPIISIQSFTIAELKEFSESVISKYIEWSEPFDGWPIIRNKSIKSTDFPFTPYRNGQHKMMGEIYKASKTSTHRLIEAPTGIGKTLASIFPALKALSEGNIARIFYFTARNTGQGVAQKAVDILKKSGMRIKSVTISAKDRVCLRKDAIRECEDCEYSDGYYSRLKDGLHALYSNDEISGDIIEKVGKEFYLCPFELSLDIALHCDVIIADYNYAFDPNVYLKRFFTDVEENYTFLIDEAHNLVDRTRSMYSAEISRDEVLAAFRLSRGIMVDLSVELNEMVKLLNDEENLIDRSGGNNSLINHKGPYKILKQSRNILKTLDTVLSMKEYKKYKKRLLDLYFSLRHFNNCGNLFDENYSTISNINDDNFVIKLYNLNPSSFISSTIGFSSSTSLFSATLTPSNYYKTMMGLNEDTNFISLPSPFPTENLKLLVASNVSTKYTQRSVTINEVVGAIETMTRFRKGRYMVFFPSYEYLNSGLSFFRSRNQEIDIISQVPEMSEANREKFLSNFDDSRELNRSIVGFAVMGGVFSEGIDLVGDKLNGVVVVGVGLPGICTERDEVSRFFGGGSGGYDYAYVYPGLTKVLQAAGRVIRTTTDRGVIMLVDERFGTEKYRTLMPKNWNPVTVVNRDSVENEIKSFYNNSDITIISSPKIEKNML